MISLNPGPSELNPKIRKAISDIAESGFLSSSHRGKEFKEVCRRAVEGLRDRMRIPQEYCILLQPSATCAMDTILRGLVVHSSFHFVHGAFSDRFFQSARQIGIEAKSFVSPWQQPVAWRKAAIDGKAELICVTHNETSTGLMWPHRELGALRKAFPEPLIVVDVTSSFGALQMDWTAGDIWFFSVQKCLGLPSGMGLILANSKALQKAAQVAQQRCCVADWQNMVVMAEKMKGYQTVETPNMFAIALLAVQMEDWDLEKIEAETLRKARMLYAEGCLWKSYPADREWASATVVNCVVEDPEGFHEKMLKKGYCLGKGYGPLKDSCVRIANFPSISEGVIDDILKSFFELLQRSCL